MAEFTTDQIFQSRDDMTKWAKSIGLKNGFVIVIDKSANKVGNKLPKCTLICDRGGKYQPPGDVLQRKTSTKKCSCPFLLRGIPIPPDGVMWGIKVVCIEHNHDLAQYLEGHEYPSRLKPEEKEIVAEMAEITAPRHILGSLKERDPSNTTNIVSVYNELHKGRKAKRGSLNTIQYALSQLLTKGYLHTYRTNPDTQQITDLLWIHKDCMKLYIQFPTVLVIAVTYQTNEYRAPFLEVVGITSTDHTYSLMFAYMGDEKIARYTWALDCLKKLIIEKQALLPSVLVSDRDLTLLSSIADVFPSAHHILCIWHINQNVMKNCSNILGADWEIFNSAWQKVYTASSIEYFEQAWQKLLCDFMSYPKAIEYLWYTWLAPYKERFVHAWTNNYMHLGCRTSQRVESAHARLKKYLENTVSTIDVLVRKIDKLLILQFGNIKKSFERSIIMRFQAYNDEIYSDLRGHVSIEALEHIDGELDKVNAELSEACNCKINSSYG